MPYDQVLGRFNRPQRGRCLLGIWWWHLRVYRSSPSPHCAQVGCRDAAGRRLESGTDGGTLSPGPRTHHHLSEHSRAAARSLRSATWCSWMISRLTFCQTRPPAQQCPYLTSAKSPHLMAFWHLLKVRAYAEGNRCFSKKMHLKNVSTMQNMNMVLWNQRINLTLIILSHTLETWKLLVMQLSCTIHVTVQNWDLLIISAMDFYVKDG